MSMNPVQEAGVGKLVFGLVIMGIAIASAVAANEHGGVVWLGGAAVGAVQIILGLIQISTGKHPHEVDKKLW